MDPADTANNSAGSPSAAGGVGDKTHAGWHSLKDSLQERLVSLVSASLATLATAYAPGPLPTTTSLMRESMSGVTAPEVTTAKQESGGYHTHKYIHTQTPTRMHTHAYTDTHTHAHTHTARAFPHVYIVTSVGTPPPVPLAALLAAAIVQVPKYFKGTAFCAEALATAFDFLLDTVLCLITPSIFFAWVDALLDNPIHFLYLGCSS
jgi:hypothetical protein